MPESFHRKVRNSYVLVQRQQLILEVRGEWREVTLNQLGRIITGKSRTATTPGGAAEYADVPGFCKSATTEEIRRHGHVLTPGRYVGAEPQPDDGEPFQEKMARLSSQWREQQAEASRLDAAIAENLEKLGFG